MGALIGLSRGSTKLYLGIAPRGTATLRQACSASVLHQGKENLHGENGVEHHHYDGELSAYPVAHFSVNPPEVDDSLAPPTLFFHKNGKESKGERIGNLLIPQGEIAYWEFFPDAPTLIAGANVHSYVYAFTNSRKIQESGKTLYIARVNYRWYKEDFSGYDMKASYARAETLEALRPVVASLLSADPFGSAGEPRSQWGGYSYPCVSYDIREHETFIPDPFIWAEPPREFFPVVSDIESRYGSLAKTAVSSMNALNFNGIAFTKEAIHWKSLLPPLKDLRNLDRSLKSWSNVYLWFRYGLSLSYKDVKLLIESMPKIFASIREFSHKPTRLRAKSSDKIKYKGRLWNVSLSYRILCDTVPKYAQTLGRLVDQAYSLDVVPTLANLWDLIPYSFVLDWVIPVQDWLENIDHYGRLQSFTIHCVTASAHFQADAKHPYIPGYVTTGSLVETHYRREVGTTLYAPTFEFHLEGKPNARRIIDGTALILQRLP